jgi:hypothetical protein
MNWVTEIGVATIFFIVGQLMLRNTFEQIADPLRVTMLFATGVGIVGLVGLFLTTPGERELQPLAAGAIFSLGYYFWVHVISARVPMGMIRIVMAGLDVAIISSASYLIFGDVFTNTNILASVIIFAGLAVAAL